MTYPTVTLTVVPGRRYVFSERATWVLGRSRDCNLRLPDDEQHTTVSRHHCLIDINPPEARIRDLGSRNGTFVNGELIGRGEPCRFERDLADGDEIRIGDTVLRVSISGTRVPAPPGDPRAAADRIPGYDVIRELGRGGMGAVYLARRTDDGALVAIKVMLPRAAASQAAHGRFLREVRITGRLRHPHIVSLLDADMTRSVFYCASEYCGGGSLADRRFPRSAVVGFIIEALSGLAYAHRQNVVHRDLSPDNILLAFGSGGGGLVAKVSDFGLAKAFDEAGLSGLTRTGATAGKPWYMARQQVLDFKDMTPAADVWAMAACLYAAITGAVPRTFRSGPSGPSGEDPWRVVMEEDAVPIREREPSIPAGLADVIDTALRERPRIGFESAEAFRDALLETAESPI